MSAEEIADSILGAKVATANGKRAAPDLEPPADDATTHDLDTDREAFGALDDEHAPNNVTSITRKPRAKKSKATPAGDSPESELCHGANLAGQLEGRVIFVRGRGWLVYDGTRYAPDALDEVRELAKVYATQARVAAAVRAIPSEVQLAARISTARGLDSLLRDAESDPRVRRAAEHLDADLFAINVLNGTIDGHTGELRAHNRDDLITKIAPVVYDPAARSDLWEKFLRDVLGDDDKIAFVQRGIGYSLTGDTREEKAFLLISGTRTGKGTFCDAISGALGDYSRTADFRTFLVDKNETGGSARPDLFRLIGSRFVTTSEVSSTARFDEARLKSLTGRDAMDCRQLYGETVSTRPTFKLWFSCNVAPRISDDDAVWSRLYRISFDGLASVPLEKRDPTMKTRLADPAVSGPAVLAWAVRGLLAWQRDGGLAPPPSVLASTRTLRDDLDTARRFLAAHVVFDRDEMTTTAELFAAYTRWCADEGEEPVTTKALTSALKKRAEDLKIPVANTRTNGKRGWQHVSLEFGDEIGATDGNA